jgi:hypothetical protein
LLIRKKFSNTGLSLIGTNQTYSPGPTDMPPANPVPYLLPPGTQLGANGIEEVPPNTNTSSNAPVAVDPSPIAPIPGI